MTFQGYVVDASVVIQRLVKEPHTEHVRRLMRNLAEQDRLWVSDFCLLEITNVIWKQVRFGNLDQERAVFMAQRIIPLLPLQVYRADGDLLAEALRIGLAQELTVYDSVYIAMAARLDCPLISVDVGQNRAAEAHGIHLKSSTDF